MHAQGKPIPVTIGSTWTLICSILEPLQTPDSDNEDECSGETKKEEPEHAIQEEKETIKATRKEYRKEEPPPPSPPVTEQKVPMSLLPSAPPFYKRAPLNEKDGKYMLSAVQKGLLEAQ